jgi:hypothetical protein
MSTQQEQEIKILPKPTDLEIFQCQTILGTGNKYMEPLNKAVMHVCSNYALKLWAMEENQEWSTESFRKLTSAKFILVREVLFKQIKMNGRFKIETGFENPCKKCNGTGELYYFHRQMQTLPCMKCNKKGILDNGNKCKTCRGKGQVKVQAIVDELRSVTTCEACHGKGYFPPQVYDNPVIDKEIANDFKRKLAEKKAQDVFGGIIHLGNIINPPEVKPPAEK